MSPSLSSTPTAAVLPLKRQTMVDLTLLAIRDRILNGSYPEGKPLRQDAIAAELGVSRIPIREALRQLETEGLIVFNPHRGAVVTTLSLEEIEEVFTLRAEIESGLVRRAVAVIDAEHLARAAAILDRYERALRSRDVVSYGKLNWEFHCTLYEAADRPVTFQVAQRLHQQSDRYIRMQLAYTHWEERAKREHRAILAAARKGDAKRAASLMRDHILRAGESLLAFLQQHRRVATSTTHTNSTNGTNSTKRAL
jgi:DNA-binding GntR family transcriptional regulator